MASPIGNLLHRDEIEFDVRPAGYQLWTEVFAAEPGIRVHIRGHRAVRDKNPSLARQTHYPPPFAIYVDGGIAMLADDDPPEAMVRRVRQ